MLPENLARLTIRSANNDDCERVTKLVFDVLAEFGLEGDPDTTDADLRDLEANYPQRGGLFEVIEDADANLLGSFGLYPINNTTCELRKMYFLPELRGLGAGATLMARCLEAARGFHFRQCYLETLRGMNAAMRLYERSGFRRIDHPMGATGHGGCNTFYLLDL